MNRYKKIIIFIIFLLIFIINTILVINNNTDSFDNYIYELIYWDSSLFTKLFKGITFFGSTIFIIIVFIVNLIINKNKRKAIFQDLAILLAHISCEAIKLLVARPRPEGINLVSEKSFSYPSGHTMISTIIYGLFMYDVINSKMKKKNKVLICSMLSTLLLFIAISRIYLGAHFASDIIGGFSLGIIFLIGYTTLFKNKLR